MKIAIFFALMAPVIFSVHAVISKRVGSITPFVIILNYGAVFLFALVSIISMNMLGMKLTWPRNGGEWWLIVSLAFLTFLGQICILGCYNRGGGVLLVTTCMALVPLASGVTRYLSGQGKFSPIQLVGCIVLAVAVFLILWEERLE